MPNEHGNDSLITLGLELIQETEQAVCEILSDITRRVSDHRVPISADWFKDGFDRPIDEARVRDESQVQGLDRDASSDASHDDVNDRDGTTPGRTR